MNTEHDKPWKIALLETRHVLTAFDSGEPALNEFLQRYAGQNSRRNLGRTFVVTLADAEQVYGYYTMAASSLRLEQIPEKLPRYPIPVILVARLAVDRTQQGRGLGELLLFDALARAERLSQELGAFALNVRAKHEKAKAFYLKYGFRELLDDKLNLYLPMKALAPHKFKGS